MNLRVFGARRLPHVEGKTGGIGAAIGHHRLPFQDKTHRAVLRDVLQDGVDFAAVGAIKISKNQYAALGGGSADDGIGGVKIDGFGLLERELCELLLKDFGAPLRFGLQIGQCGLRSGGQWQAGK